MTAVSASMKLANDEKQEHKGDFKQP